MRLGFSLVELSIVLVILGLLTGGILTGQNLIRAAELRSVTTEFQAYQTAAMTFRNKYFALPGDIKNATDFWGSMSDCTAVSPTATGTQTCNGNGNGRIDNAPALSKFGERFGWWQQLANAGLIEGSYTGIAGASDPTHHILGTNAPNSRFGNGGWSATYRNASINHFNRVYGNTLHIGATTASSAPTQSIFTPEEAWNIDKKIDDGKPGRGRVTPMSFTDDCTDAANADDLDAEYSLSDSSVQCTLHFIKPY